MRKYPRRVEPGRRDKIDQSRESRDKNQWFNVGVGVIPFFFSKDIHHINWKLCAFVLAGTMQSNQFFLNELKEMPLINVP